jgi:cobalt-zinc-cadmium efflux system protein
MRGALAHVVGDILGSIAAIVSAIIIGTTGFLYADPLVTLLVCGLIGRSAFKLLAETGRVLLQGAPPGVDVEDLRREVRSAHDNIVDVHRVQVWMLTPELPQVNLHLRVKKLSDATATLHAVKRMLSSRFDEVQSTVQVEAASEPVGDMRDDGATVAAAACPDEVVAAKPKSRTASTGGLSTVTPLHHVS